MLVLGTARTSRPQTSDVMYKACGRRTIVLSDEPKYKSQNFKCPHCCVVAQQIWFNHYQLSEVVFNIYTHVFLDYRARIPDHTQERIRKFLDTAKRKFPNDINSFLPRDLAISTCQACKDFSIWVNEDIVYPRTLPIDPPNEDLNDDIKSLYNEASRIFIDSPKGSTALLRLALQKLLKQIGKEGKNINADIKALVEDGLSPTIQKALDLLRVIGNNAVHPGQINLDDNTAVALKLFKILNIIADEMITKPNEIDTLYSDIVPDETKGHIDQRDGRNTT